MLMEAIRLEANRFGFRPEDFIIRAPEQSELFDEEDTRKYIEGCDYLKSADDLLLALELQNAFGIENIRNMRILDAMCGPGRLGRELLGLGVSHVTFHDGHRTMINHAEAKATETLASNADNQSVRFVTSDAESTGLLSNEFDLVVCHNSIHQLRDDERLRGVIEEFARVTAPGGHIVIADYQRDPTSEFVDAITERLENTDEQVVDLLRDTFKAAFSKDEFASVLRKIPGISHWLVADARQPDLLDFDLETQIRIAGDHIKGHLMDYSSISQRVIVRKAQI
ncbi:TPA: hypothetical protein DIS56_02450 [Candidatus Saccharibacteria bacterium]|nr:MAG: hypothetical protein UX30_C0005G0011 [Candidatus Saccharibacteria bacterium GW2011_GWA2_46_10]OGL35463.1 MAG: hypothetical protein A3F05_03725 [Candidatus Saccharibacteria bacterium RIFCSPHIGHO2_12_FULL_47_17]HCM51970.1 hypothetical protein [Candidatus Saccharibacteria bacterium]